MRPSFGLLSLYKCNSRAKKEPQSQKVARTVPKKFLNHSRALPNKTRVLRQITRESSPESSAKSLSHKFFGVPFLSLNDPKGPKIAKIQDRPPGSNISSEIENCKRAAHQTPCFFSSSFFWGILKVRIEHFQARLKCSSEIDYFISIFGP